jgi:hypothetical protein
MPMQPDPLNRGHLSGLWRPNALAFQYVLQRAANGPAVGRLVRLVYS